jgi:NAD(P)-dependent dehydrogenase (short-subunit alcohol dehydrogenase family)
MKKNVLITGASGNLGKATVEKFLAEGYRVLVTVSPGKTFSPDKEVISYEADLTHEQSVNDVVAQIIEQHKTIDAALLLVGGFAMGNIGNTDGDSIRKMMELNFNTAYHVARPVFNQMVRQGGGRLVFVGSRPALVAAEGKNTLAYALSKSLVFKLAELLNAAGESNNVVSSVIVPGTIDTPLNRKSLPDANFADWVTPEEIAEAISFIVSNNGKALRKSVLKLYGNS